MGVGAGLFKGESVCVSVSVIHLVEVGQSHELAVLDLARWFSSDVTIKC